MFWVVFKIMQTIYLGLIWLFTSLFSSSTFHFSVQDGIGLSLWPKWRSKAQGLMEQSRDKQSVFLNFVIWLPGPWWVMLWYFQESWHSGRKGNTSYVQWRRNINLCTFFLTSQMKRQRYFYFYLTQQDSIKDLFRESDHSKKNLL